LTGRKNKQKKEKTVETKRRRGEKLAEQRRFKKLTNVYYEAKNHILSVFTKNYKNQRYTG